MLPIVADVIERAARNQRRQENVRLIRHRFQFRLTHSSFELPERRFIELFRVNKNIARHLINQVEPHLVQPVLRRGITPEISVLAALRFYATGSYQRSIGQEFNLGLSQTSAHRCIRKVTNIIDQHLADLYIKFPNTREERQTIKVEFMERWGFPGCIGAVDGTHIAILKPRTEEHNFINRKGFHSLNIQIICNHNLQILSLNTNYGGSTHDAFIWRNSIIQRYLQYLHQNGEHHTWLIGDAGYPLQPYLITPIMDAGANTPEAAFNSSLTSARNCIERAIGVLKIRFRCLLKERVARYEPTVVAKLVSSASMLHNLCLLEGLPLIGNANDPLPQEEVYVYQIYKRQVFYVRVNIQEMQLCNNILQIIKCFFENLLIFFNYE